MCSSSKRGQRRNRGKWSLCGTYWMCNRHEIISNLIHHKRTNVILSLIVPSFFNFQIDSEFVEVLAFRWVARLHIIFHFVCWKRKFQTSNGWTWRVLVFAWSCWSIKLANVATCTNNSIIVYKRSDNMCRKMFILQILLFSCWKNVGTSFSFCL